LVQAARGFLGDFAYLRISKNHRMREKIEEALNSIRPYLEADGGNVELLEITEDMVVKVELQGACRSCSMSSMTMKAGIEETIRKAVPEITKVEAVNI
jgi:Fe-S cluster biogenesis protein NfuA